MKGRRISLDNNLVSEYKKKLTVQPFIPGNNIPVFYKLYKLTNKWLYIPKYFSECGEVIENEEKESVFKMETKPREYQKNVISDIISELRINKSCIACLYTGWGKTFASLYIAYVLGVKTLIIVNKESLLKQWEEQIVNFFGIKPGIIQGKCINNEPDICIGMIQSISMKEYPKDTFECFTLTIYDETHHYCSKVFSEVFYKIGSKYNLGLTATIKRADRLDYTLQWFLGKIAVNVQLLLIEPLIKIYNYYEYPCDTLKFLPNGKVACPSTITNITQIETRNKLLLDLIKECYASDRNILILTERKSHCDYIYTSLCNSYDIGKYYGGMKAEELKKSNECKIIVATYQMASEGYNNPKLDTLILASPKVNIEQSVGRILRQKNKNPALVIDICDNLSVFNNWNKKRQCFYKSKKFKIELQNEEYETSTELTIDLQSCLIID